MPTDTFAGANDDHRDEDAPTEGHDGLTFTTHDLGRDRPPTPPEAELGFAVAPRPAEDAPGEPLISFVPARRETAAPPPPPPPADVNRTATARQPTPADGFVIREAHGVAPAAPVDSLVVGAAPAAEAVAEVAFTPVPRRDSFRIGSNTQPGAPAPSSEPPWMVREPDPGSGAAPALSRRGWSTRHSSIPDASANAAILRLREEAVHVSWKSAWIAVKAADPRRSRKRRR